MFKKVLFQKSLLAKHCHLMNMFYLSVQRANILVFLLKSIQLTLQLLDLITESCMSPVYNNQPVQPLSDAKDSSMDTILTQQYEDCAIQAEANFQLQLVNNLASKFTACS